MRIFLLWYSLLSVHCIFASSIHFLTVADIHYDSQVESKDGYDTGPGLWRLALAKIHQLNAQVDFIITLGDLPGHSLFDNSNKKYYEQQVFHDLYTADYTKKPLFYVTGNNDSLTGNYQPFNVAGKSPLSYALEWTGACAHCAGLLIDKSHMISHGYYSSYVMPNNKDIILIALNTIPWVNRPIYLPAYLNQEEDALHELAWFAQQLKNHRAKQLLIAMHIPPGHTYNGMLLWEQKYTEQFIKILQKYSASYPEITMLIAHTHMDEIRKINLSKHRAVYAYATPSISPIHHNNPSLKVFELARNLAINNYTTYYSSTLATWQDEYYQALGTAPKVIFPMCRHHLTRCLQSLTQQELCQALEVPLFYGVQSNRVFAPVCAMTFAVN